MEKITITFTENDLDLANILRQRIDDCAQFKRNAEASEDLMRDYITERRILTEEEKKQAEDVLHAALLKSFLDAKESLIIPDDGLHKLFTDDFQNAGNIKITWAYQDFYAYQFVDILNNIVHRAFKVRALFAKNQPPESVKRLCREAYQCYLYGFHTASVALIRSVIETALIEKLGKDIGGVPLLNKAALEKGIYESKIYNKVNQINKIARNFIHNTYASGTPSEFENLKLLGLAQEVLQALGE